MPNLITAYKGTFRRHHATKIKHHRLYKLDLFILASNGRSYFG
jgi:hypothetical protein